VADYDKAILFRPDYADAHNNRGFALARLSRHDEAIASYDRALALQPDHPLAHSNRREALQEREAGRSVENAATR